MEQRNDKQVGGRKEDVDSSRESEDLYKNIFNQMLDGVVAASTENRKIRTVNHAICRMMGYSAEELTGLSVPDLHPAESLPHVIAQFENQVKEGSLAKDIPMKRKDGSVFYADVNASVILLGGKKHLVGIFRDITERRDAEKEILALSKFPSENRNPVMRVLLNGKIMYANIASRYLLQKWGTGVGKCIPEFWWQLAADVYNTGLTTKTAEAEVSGHIYEITMTPIKGAGYINLYASDVTERKKAENALKKTHAELEKEKTLLTRKNIAFREAIKEIDIGKNELKDDIMANVNEIILPILKKIRLEKGENLNEYLDLIEKNLETLTSSFGRKLTGKAGKLTPKEVEICNMVKSGLTSGEISRLLKISVQTINKHRKNIRRKLGLTNEDVNLTSFLREL